MSEGEVIRFQGIYPSIICPLMDDFRIDEGMLAAHIAAVTSTEGVAGILCNGHAGENFLLSRGEQKRVVEIAKEVLSGRFIIVAGINAESSLEAIKLASDAQDAGADALMVFPPYSWALSQDNTVAVKHHMMINAAIGLPIMLFQGSVRAGQLAYTPHVLTELARMPGVVAIKEGSWETSAYDATRRLLKEIAPHVAVMASGDEHLLTCFVLGSEGSLVSLGVLIPEAIVELDRAVRRSDLDRARRVHEVIYPLAKAIYGTAPYGRVVGRLKTCLKLLGRISCDAVRPPMVPLEELEVHGLRKALQQSGLL
jgi:4-hydroxy-tetrahydrodipicolinate synthase